MTSSTPKDELAALLFDYERRIKALESASQLSTSTVGEDSDTSVDDIVADASVSNSAIPDLQESAVSGSQDNTDLQALITASNALIDAMFVDAAQNLSDARDSLEQSQQDISDAFGQRVDGLSDDVDTAISAAGSAKTEAEAATEAAQAAAGLAGSLGQTFIQVSKPTGARADPKNLWINISPDSNGVPKNQPNRYDSSIPDWVPITDAQAVAAAQTAANAVAAAQAAKDAADQANAAAGVAKTAADNANTTALQAAGIANGKGKVIPQASKPTGVNAAVGNLWIRTTDNTPWVYDASIPDWVQVTDQTAKDAAANAVAAQQTATAAANAAAAAQATADSRPQILFSSSAGPSGTAPTGTIWFLWDSAKNVAGQWLQSGTLASPVWTPQQIRSEVIANLDVAKLTVGSAAIADLVAQKIAASTANFQTANVSNLFVTSGATMSQAVIDFLFANVVQAKKITAGMIDVGSLTGVTLTGITISGGTFTTTKSTSTQPWLRVASQSVTFYDGSDTMRGYVQAANGRLTIAGTSDTASSFFMVGRTTYTVPGIAFNQSFVSDVNMGDTYVNGDLMTSGQVRDSYSRTPMNQTVGGSAGGRRLVANSFTVPTTEAAAADQTQVVDVIQYNRTDGKVYVYADVLQNRATGARFLDDTGWVFPTLNAGTNDSNDPFRVRRLNGVVYFGGLITPTAASQTAISALAAQFRPLASIGAYLNRGGTSTTAGQWLVRVGSAGNVVLVGAGNSPGGTGNIDMAGFPPFPAGQ